MRRVLLISCLTLITSKLFASTTSLGPVLSFVAEPNLAYILLILGVYGLIFELATPGLILPGVLGGICIAFGIYGLVHLPLNPLGLALMFSGVVLMVAETFVMFFGLLAILGAVSFAVGSFYLMSNNPDNLSIAWPTVLIMTLLTTGFFILIINMAIRARQKKPITGKEQLIGSIAIVDFDFEKTGTVRLGGEHWNAVTNAPVTKDALVKITALHGLTVTIELIKN